MEDSMEEFKRFYNTHSEIGRLFDTEDDKKEFVDLTIRSIKGERFACRNYLCDWYSQLTAEQKKFIVKFQVLLGSALVEDNNDNEYNLQNFDILNNNFSMKGGIIIGS